MNREEYYKKEVKNSLDESRKADEEYGKQLDKLFPTSSIPEFATEEWEKLEEMRKDAEEKRIKLANSIEEWLALFS